MKKEITVIEHFAKKGLDSRDTPFLDDIEKLDLMCEYFEIILDCLEGRLPSDRRIQGMRGDIDEDYDEEDTWDTGYGCGCGGNCLCGEEA